MIASIKTKERLVKRILSREGYHPVIVGDKLWLAEPENKVSILPNGYSQIVGTSRLVCIFEDDDNIWGLRHVRATRAWDNLQAEWKRRVEAPQKERQFQANEAKKEFEENFATWAGLQGYFGYQTY